MYKLYLKEDTSKVWYAEHPCFCVPVDDMFFSVGDDNGNCLYLQETGCFYAIEGRSGAPEYLPKVYVEYQGGEHDVYSYREMTEAIKDTDINVAENSNSIDDLWVAVLEG